PFAYLRFCFRLAPNFPLRSMPGRTRRETRFSPPPVTRDSAGFLKVLGSFFPQEPARRSRGIWHPPRSRLKPAELCRVFGFPFSKSSCRLCDPRLRRQNCFFSIPNRLIPDGGKPGLASSARGRPL